MVSERSAPSRHMTMHRRSESSTAVWMLRLATASPTRCSSKPASGRTLSSPWLALDEGSRAREWLRLETPHQHGADRTAWPGRCAPIGWHGPAPHPAAARAGPIFRIVSRSPSRCVPDLHGSRYCPKKNKKFLTGTIRTLYSRMQNFRRQCLLYARFRLLCPQERTFFEGVSDFRS